MPQLSKARELREERKQLVVQAQELANKPDNTKEDRASAQKMLDDADGLKTQIDLLERADNAGEEFRAGRSAPPAGQPNGGNPDDEKTGREKYHRAFVNYLKFGEAQKMRGAHLVRGVSQEDHELLYRSMKRLSVALTTEDQEHIQSELRALGASRREMRDMGTGGQGAYPSATTGFFVPVGFVDRVEEALKYYGPMLDGGPGMPEIMDTATGQPLPFPTDNDTTITGELIGEGQQVTSQDVSLNQIILGAYKYSSKLVKVSIELLQDSAFDLEPYLVKKFATRLGRILNNHFTVGTGTTQPYGIVTQAALGATAVGSSGNDGTGASTNTIGSDDLISLEHSVDPLYRRGALYMMHDSTLKSIKLVKDKYGRPLWSPGLASNTPDMINGYAYKINNDMAALQTSASSPPVTAKTVIFGDLSKYMIRRVKEMSVLRLEERFADFGQIAFLAFARYDAATLDAGTHPTRYLANIY